MARLPFSDSPMDDAPTPPARGKGDQPLTVSEVSDLIKLVVTDSIKSPIRIVGQISNFTNRSHWFFSLKDEDSQLRCVCFASSASRISLKPKDGMEVVCTGRLDYYGGQGQLQLYVNRMEPVGVGALEIQFRELCEELRGLGYFDPAHKQETPLVAQRIAVVTSRSAAALQDVIDTTRRRWPGCQLYLYDVRVQGKAAAPEIAAAIRNLSQNGESLGIDAILVTRGGGSMEDLWAFNERIVADAIYDCQLPIVAAIGHETDTTVAELVADVRCATPTQAAMTLVPDREALAHQVDQLARRMQILLSQQVRYMQQRLRAVERHPVMRNPQSLIADHRRDLEQRTREFLQSFKQRHQWATHELQLIEPRFIRSLEARLKADQQKLESLDKRLNSVGPQQVLNRGFTYTVNSKGKLIRSAGDVQTGESIKTMLADGAISSVVSDGDRPVPSKSSAKPKKKPTKKSADEEQGSLFE